MKISRDMYAISSTPLDHDGTPVIVVSGLLKANKKQQYNLLEYLLYGLTQKGKEVKRR